MRVYVAVDIGASSGRHMVGWMEEGIFRLEEAYRFENTPVQRNGHLCWDIDGLFEHVVEGLAACKARGFEPVSLGIDTWAVDYVLLDAAGERIGDCVCYRDGRTAGMPEAAEALIPYPELYERTGIQRQSFNTLYQLMAERREDPEGLARARRFLMVPDYLHYRLTGRMANEFTNATSTALFSAREGTWDAELLGRLGLPGGLFAPPLAPGAPLGPVTEDIRDRIGYAPRVVLPATHDTASAYLAAPGGGKDTVTISSGTWSLLGVERQTPLLSPQAREAGFTNEGGYGGSYRFLKNIMGLWMIQSIRRDLGKRFSYAELERLAVEAGPFESLVDVNDASFFAPENMSEAVRAYCERTGQPQPGSLGETVRCVYRSLAASYREALEDLRRVTGRDYAAIHIVGGGSKDVYLNQWTADVTGLPVYAGPTESTAIGNLMVQMTADGVFADIGEARAAVAQSFTQTIYEKRETHGQV